jgi:hypothetical protein
MLALRKVIAMLLALLAQQAAEQKDFKPLGEISGTDTAIEQRMVTMATTKEEFVQLWRRHKEIFGAPPTLTGTTVVEEQIPSVVFSKNVVVAYFAGQTNGIGGYRVVEVDTKGKTLAVTIAPVPIQTEFSITANTFGMWVFPKPKRTVELVLREWDRQGRPSDRTIAKLDPPKTGKSG